LDELFNAELEKNIIHATIPIAAAAIGAAIIKCHECHNRKVFPPVTWVTVITASQWAAVTVSPLSGAEAGGMDAGPLDGSDRDVPSDKWAAGVSGGLGGCQPSGGITGTMHPHFGHSKMAPTTSALRTASRTWQVVQVMVNNACRTVPSKIG
jgi:hypothetical protein